jgi:hypothetical protein
MLSAFRRARKSLGQLFRCSLPRALACRPASDGSRHRPGTACAATVQVALLVPLGLGQGQDEILAEAWKTPRGWRWPICRA